MARHELMLKLIQGPRILDVGCTGHFVEPTRGVHARIRQAFPDAEVWGFDLSPENVKEMQEFGFENVDVGDAQDFSYDQKFDTIVAGELIEHLESPGRFLSCARAHLAPGGRVIVTTPYPFALLHFLYAARKFPKTVPNPEHSVWLCPSTMGEQASRAGLRVSHMELFRQGYIEGGPRLYDFIRRVTGYLPKRVGATNALYVMEAI